MLVIYTYGHLLTWGFYCTIKITYVYLNIYYSTVISNRTPFHPLAFLLMYRDSLPLLFQWINVFLRQYIIILSLLLIYAIWTTTNLWFSKPPTPTTNTSLPEVQVQEFVARHKVGTIFASTTESDGAIIWGEHVAIKCEEMVEYDLNNTSSHFPPYSSTLNNVQTQLLVKNLDTIQPQII